MQNWEEGEKKINRKAYQSQQRALSSMIIRGQWDAHMGDKEKKEWIMCSSALLQAKLRK